MESRRTRWPTLTADERLERRREQDRRRHAERRARERREQTQARTVADLGGGEGGTCPPFKVANFFFLCVMSRALMRATDIYMLTSRRLTRLHALYMPRLYMYMTVLSCGCVGVVDAVTWQIRSGKSTCTTCARSNCHWAYVRHMWCVTFGVPIRGVLFQFHALVDHLDSWTSPRSHAQCTVAP